MHTSCMGGNLHLQEGLLSGLESMTHPATKLLFFLFCFWLGTSGTSTEAAKSLVHKSLAASTM